MRRLFSVSDLSSASSATRFSSSSHSLDLAPQRLDLLDASGRRSAMRRIMRRARAGARRRRDWRATRKRNSRPACGFHCLGFGQPPLGEVRQFQILEKDVEKFLASKHETETVLAIAFARLFRSPAAPVPGGLGMMSPSTKALVARQDLIADVRLRPLAEARLSQAVNRQGDLAAVEHISDITALQRFALPPAARRFWTRRRNR